MEARAQNVNRFPKHAAITDKSHQFQMMTSFVQAFVILGKEIKQKEL